MGKRGDNTMRYSLWHSVRTRGVGLGVLGFEALDFFFTIGQNIVCVEAKLWASLKSDRARQGN